MGQGTFALQILPAVETHKFFFQDQQLLHLSCGGAAVCAKPGHNILDLSFYWTGRDETEIHLRPLTLEKTKIKGLS